MTDGHHDQRDRAAHTSEPRVSPSCTRSMTWPTSSGWARVARAPSTLRTAIDDEHRLVLEDERQQLPERRARALRTLRAPRPRRRAPRRERSAGDRTWRWVRTRVSPRCSQGVTVRPYFLWTACRLTPRAEAIACQECPRLRARRTWISSARASSRRTPARRCSSAIGAPSGADPMRVRMSSPLMRASFRLIGCRGRRHPCQP